MTDKSSTRSNVTVTHRPILRWTLIFAGTVFVGIGILGIFIPLLPTTVFLLMAAWCYARSSHRFYDWLHHNKIFGKYLKNYREGRGITVSSKVTSIAVLWGGILYSMYVVPSLIVRLILAAIAIGVTIHIVLIPTNRER